jgi:hypothetical protein
MECEMDFCDAPAVAFVPVWGVRRHLCEYHATGRGASNQEPEQPALTRPAVPDPRGSTSNDQEKYTRRNRKRHR